uniref:Uncharacterized protein n=1 Tax=Romanomermis culicivorax TaxID=13658 RepID=A0A915L4I5_ROMCU
MAPPRKPFNKSGELSKNDAQKENISNNTFADLCETKNIDFHQKRVTRIYSDVMKMFSMITMEASSSSYSATPDTSLHGYR